MCNEFSSWGIWEDHLEDIECVWVSRSNSWHWCANVLPLAFGFSLLSYFNSKYTIAAFPYHPIFKLNKRSSLISSTPIPTLAATILLSVSIIYIYIPCVREMYLSFSVWYFTWHNTTDIHSCCCKWQCFILFLWTNNTPLYIYIYMPQFLYSFIHQWTLKLFLYLGYCKYYCNEHRHTDIFFN